MIEIRHKETGGVLARVNADTLVGANLDAAVLEEADLSEADRGGANLEYANPALPPHGERKGRAGERDGEPVGGAGALSGLTGLGGETGVDGAGQREEYPALAGKSRLATYPELTAQPRADRHETAAAEWQLERVTSYLGEGKWPRQASQRGQISRYGRAYEVGRRYGGEAVWVRFDAVTGEWVIEGKEGEELRRHPAEQITAERIRQLQVSKPHASSKRRSRPEERPPNVTLRYAA